MLLVDERRLRASGTLDPASFLAGLVGRRVLREDERRAMVRRIAATRDDVTLPAHVRRSPSFARLVLEGVDRGAVAAPFETLAGHLRTLAAFADTLDVRSALLVAMERACRLDGDLRIEAPLVASDDDAFAWRRLAAASGVAFTVVEPDGPPQPAVDPRAIDGVAAVIAYAAGGRDADARRALLAPQSGVDPDEARTLLTTAGERAELLDVIARGSSAAASRFAQSLATIAATYRAAGTGAATLLATIETLFPLPDEATRTVLARIATAFDGARAFAPQWEAHELIDELLAELPHPVQRTGSLSIAPAPPVADEPAAPVPVRTTSFSASSLNAYAECARKWWFRYACAAVEDRGSSASFYGIAFHAALEEFHGHYARFDGALDRPALATALDRCIVEAFDRHRTRFDAPVAYELQKRRARRTAGKYLAWLEERARRAPFEVAGCETSIEIELGGRRFVGFIDRLDRDLATGTVTVVDYKTGSIATSAEEYLADVRAFREFQLPFYYWARTAAGDVVTRLALIPLKDALVDVAPVELDVVTTSRAPRSRGTTGEIALGELERARERMAELAERLASGTIEHFPATSDPDACRYCAYADACRERPLVLEERFAR